MWERSTTYFWHKKSTRSSRPTGYLDCSSWFTCHDAVGRLQASTRTLFFGNRIWLGGTILPAVENDQLPEPSLQIPLSDPTTIYTLLRTTIAILTFPLFSLYPPP